MDNNEKISVSLVLEDNIKERMKIKYVGSIENLDLSSLTNGDIVIGDKNDVYYYDIYI